MPSGSNGENRGETRGRDEENEKEPRGFEKLGSRRTQKHASPPPFGKVNWVRGV